MPQTREHVHVLELLGVTHMVVALTMCDLADAEMTELAELDVDDFLSGTVFAGAPIVPVSSKTGEGIDGLLAVLDEQVSACWDACRNRAERTDAAPRLPIDRCFTIKGVGTVVTGTLHDAPVAVGDELMALPSRTVCRVRGIQVHGDTPRALPGQRVALNLVGDGVAALDRGEMLGVADRFGQTLRFMMTFTYLGREGAKPRVLESGARVHVMAGHGRGCRPHHAFGGRGPMAVGETRTGRCAWRSRCRCEPETMPWCCPIRPLCSLAAGVCCFRAAVARASLPKESVRCMRRSSPAISRAVWALGWRCRRCRLRRLMLPRLWILVSARSMPHCAGWCRRALFASLLWVMRTTWRTPWCSMLRWMHWRRPCQPCTRRLPRRRALRPAPLPMLRGLPLMMALPRL
ncbi:MAG: GTP-binding protein [Collinsella aerofaciens]